MQKLLNGCERVMLYVSTLSAFILMLLTTADAGGRYLFNHPLTGAYEITTNYLMVAAIFLGASYGYHQGAYIRVTFLIDRLPRMVKLTVNHFVQVISMLYGGLLVIATYKQALRTIESHTALSSLDFIPLGPAYVIVPVGLFFMSLSMLIDLRKVRKGSSPLFAGESPTT
jgi:TRAP-type C4-dicarboxylate transport system permease small subunit